VSTLNELIQDVNSALDYNPSLEPYRKQVSRAINQHYLEISSRYPWKFLQKQTDFNLYAPVAGTAGVTVEKDATNNRKVNGVGTSFGSHMEGHYLVVAGEKRRIVNVTSTTVLYLQTAFANGEIDTATDDWSIVFEAYDLPLDLADVLGIMSREDDRGRISLIDARKEEAEFLDADLSGDAIVAVEKPTEVTEAPSSKPTAAVSGGGTLAASTTYEYFYTVTQFGRESAPSPVVEATTTSSGTDKVTLSNLDNLDFSTGNWSGRTRKIYRRNRTRGSRFFLVAEQAAASLGTTFNDTGSDTPGYETAYFEEDGMRHRLRMWFTPSTDMTVELRYQSIPRRLQGDGDQPAWPKQYHHLLVYMALKDAGMQHGLTGLSQMYERRADELLDQMRARYLTSANRDYVRQGFDKHLMQWQNRWGIPSKT